MPNFTAGCGTKRRRLPVGTMAVGRALALAVTAEADSVCRRAAAVGFTLVSAVRSGRSPSADVRWLLGRASVKSVPNRAAVAGEGWAGLSADAVESACYRVATVRELAGFEKGSYGSRSECGVCYSAMCGVSRGSISRTWDCVCAKRRKRNPAPRRVTPASARSTAAACSTHNRHIVKRLFASELTSISHIFLHLP